MAGFIKLSKTKEALMVGRTKHMHDEGKTPEQIAEALKQPIQRVNYWIGLCVQADKIRKEMKG